MKNETWDEWAEANLTIKDAIEHLKGMGLTKAKIKYKFFEAGLEVCPLKSKTKSITISKEMVKEAIKQFIIKENKRDEEILRKRNGTGSDL